MSAILERFAEALLDPERPVPEGLNGTKAGADARRFAVYRNNVFVSLVAALESRFPVSRRLVGDAFFRAMARAYAAQERPASPLLMHYGDGLPDYIRAFAPAASVPYLGDVAELEVRWSAAYHAADTAPLGLAALAIVPSDDLPRLVLRRHPAAHLVRSRYPVGSIWSANQGEIARPVGHADAETVLIVRPEVDVKVSLLPAADVPFAVRLLDGATIGDAAADLAQGFDFGRALVGLVSLGAFSGFTTSGAQEDVS